MSKAYDLMTQALATCTPDESASRAARIMRERDIGNVLVVEDGKLCGIVTDRDLAVNALAGDGGDSHAPVSRFMSTKIITGSAGWNINKVAKTMARHQIRRLPIVDEGKLVGIVSLGDIARHNTRSGVVTKLLKDVSKPGYEADTGKPGHLGTWIGLSLAALSTSMIAWLTWSHNGQQLRKQMVQSKPYYSAAQAVNTARDKVNEVASSKSAQNLRKQVRSNIKEFSQQIPSIEFKPPKRKRAWFR
jgi:CBS domain-containing protein